MSGGGVAELIGFVEELAHETTSLELILVNTQNTVDLFEIFTGLDQLDHLFEDIAVQDQAFTSRGGPEVDHLLRCGGKLECFSGRLPDSTSFLVVLFLFLQKIENLFETIRGFDPRLELVNLQTHGSLLEVAFDNNLQQNLP